MCCIICAHTNTHARCDCVVAFSPIAKPQNESKQQKNEPILMVFLTVPASWPRLHRFFHVQLCLRLCQTVKRAHTHKVYARMQKKTHGYQLNGFYCKYLFQFSSIAVFASHKKLISFGELVHVTSEMHKYDTNAGKLQT